MISAALILVSAVVSWSIPDMIQNHSGTPYEMATSVLIVFFAGFSLWSNGPNPILFGLIIGSGWFFLNRFSELIFPVSAE